MLSVVRVSRPNLFRHHDHEIILSVMWLEQAPIYFSVIVNIGVDINSTVK